MRAFYPAVCTLLIVAFATSVSAQDDAPRTLATTSIFAHEIEILSDGTWQFVEPNISLADIDLKDPICSQLDDGRVTFCHPEGEWERAGVYASDGLNEYLYYHPSGLTLTVSEDQHYGYDGDLEFYRDLSKPDLGDRLLSSALDIVFGVDFETENVLIIDDVVYSEMILNNEGMSVSMYVELMVQNQSIWIDLSGYQYEPEDDQDNLATAFSGATKDVYNGITIDGQTLSDLLAAEGKD